MHVHDRTPRRTLTAGAVPCMHHRVRERSGHGRRGAGLARSHACVSTTRARTHAHTRTRARTHARCLIACGWRVQSEACALVRTGVAGGSATSISDRDPGRRWRVTWSLMSALCPRVHGRGEPAATVAPPPPSTLLACWLRSEAARRTTRTCSASPCAPPPAGSGGCPPPPPPPPWPSPWGAWGFRGGRRQ